MRFKKLSKRYPIEPLERRTFLAAGALDPTFGTNGIVSLSATSQLSAATDATAVQADGKILVAGQACTSAGASSLSAGDLARFNADGTPDTTFGTGGDAHTT
jgi:hypothetical protein